MKKRFIGLASGVCAVMVAATSVSFASVTAGSNSRDKRDEAVFKMFNIVNTKLPHYFGGICDDALKGDNSFEFESGITNESLYAEEVAALVNKERKAAGLSELTLNSKLSKAAQIKAEDMRDNKYFSHISPTFGSSFEILKSLGITYSSAGENIAKGQKSAESVMQAWMNSQGHRANILGISYEEIGIGYCIDSDGNTYWVQLFIG